VSHGHLGCEGDQCGWFCGVPELTEKFAVGSPLTACSMLKVLGVFGAAKRLGDAAAGALEATMQQPVLPLWYLTNPLLMGLRSASLCSNSARCLNNTASTPTKSLAD